MNIEETRKLLNDKFGNIEFIEESHQYFINGDEYTPVSHVISEYEPYVDWDKKAEIYAEKNNRKDSDVKREWKLNNLKSTISGTRTHEFGESYTNLMCGHPELICEANKPQYIKEYNTLVSTYPKEDAIKKFYDEISKTLKPIGAEFKLSTEHIGCKRKVCGTCDILFWDEKENGYVIGDWKTNKSLKNDFSRNKKVMMNEPFSSMYNEPLSHYVIQFNLYRRMLESVGINITGMKLIWLKDDGDYEVINIEKIPDEIIDRILNNVKITFDDSIIDGLI